MNHIDRLQKENRVMRRGLHDLFMYVSSPKFYTDHNVNCSDIMLRINEIHNALSDIPYEVTDGKD